MIRVQLDLAEQQALAVRFLTNNKGFAVNRVERGPDGSLTLWWEEPPLQPQQRDVGFIRRRWVAMLRWIGIGRKEVLC